MQSQVVNEAIRITPQIIEKAAASPLGILALMTLVIAVLAFFYFRRAGEKTGVIMFTLMLAGVAVFAIAVGRTMSQVSTASPRPAAVQTKTRDSTSEQPALVRQETKGDMSPALHGVKGKVTIIRNAEPESKKRHNNK